MRDSFVINDGTCISESQNVAIKEDQGFFCHWDDFRLFSGNWPCTPTLHMPSLRNDNVFQEFENEVVRIGCFSSTTDLGMILE